MDAKKQSDASLKRESSRSSWRDSQDYLPSYEMAVGDRPPSISKTKTEVTVTEQEAQSTDEEPIRAPKPMTLASRVIWGCLVAVPLLAAGVLTFLATASTDSWRADLCVMKVSLPEAVWTPLNSAAQNEGSSFSDPATNVSLGTIFRRGVRSRGGSKRDSDVAGYLSLGPWGWCLRDIDATELTCSDRTAWYNLDDLLNAANLPSGTIESDDFNSVLLHGMVLHGFALLAVMLSLAPVGINVWKRYYRHNLKSEAGWFQHGSILASFIFSGLAALFDTLLVHYSATSLSSYTVASGPAQALTGAAALILLVTFFLSAMPVMVRYVRQQHRHLQEMQHVAPVEAVPAPSAAEEPSSKEKRRQRKREKKEEKRDRREERRSRRRDRRGW